MTDDDGMAALTTVLAAALLLGLLLQVTIAVADVLLTSRRARSAADAAALALIGESPAARLPALLDGVSPPPAADADGDPADASPPVPSTPPPDSLQPTAAALDLAGAVARANGAELVRVDAAGWPNSVLVEVTARPAGPIAALWDGLDAVAAAAVRGPP